MFTIYAQPLGLTIDLSRGWEAAQEPLSRRSVGDKVHKLADMLGPPPAVSWWPLSGTSLATHSYIHSSIPNLLYLKFVQ